MKEIFLLKLGEIVLKGANKRQFEDKLRQNVRRRMKPYGDFDVYIMQSTVYVEPMNDLADVDGAWDACHHIFGNAFYAFLYAHVANAHTSCGHENHIEGHCHGVTQQATEYTANCVGIKTHQIAFCHFVQVVGHPTGNGGVEHHQNYVAGDGSVFEQVPFGSFRFQNVKGFCRTALTRTTNGEFCYHDGQAQDEQED